MTDDSEVGYGKPPKQTRFKKGQSGNPRGRPKGSKSLNTLITRELESHITIEQNGIKRKIARKEALVKGLINDALKGKDRPRDKVIDYVERVEAAGAKGPTKSQLSEYDARILERFIARAKSSSTGGRNGQ
jgi:hypothetical protein